MLLSDLWPLLGRRRDCDRTSVSFTHLLWEKPGGFRWFVSKEQEPRGASGFFAWWAVFSLYSLYRWCSGQRFCMTAEQPLEEGARRRRRIDPHSGKKMMLNDPHPRIVISREARNLCHSRLRDSRFPHMRCALLRFPQLSFMPLEPYPARYARHLPRMNAIKLNGRTFLAPHRGGAARRGEGAT